MYRSQPPTVIAKRISLPTNMEEYERLKRTANAVLNGTYRSEYIYTTCTYDNSKHKISDHMALIIRIYVEKSCDIEYFRLMNMMTHMYRELTAHSPIPIKNKVYLDHIIKLRAGLTPPWIVKDGIEKYSLWSIVIKLPISLFPKAVLPL